MMNEHVQLGRRVFLRRFSPQAMRERNHFDDFDFSVVLFFEFAPVCEKKAICRFEEAPE